MAIANARYGRTHLTTNRNVSLNAKRRVWYCTYERGSREQRGIWYGPEGRQSYQQVRTWSQEQSHEHKYMYTLVLSVREGIEIQPEDFCRVMEADRQFEDWRLIEHTNTDNRHAHVIVFTDKTLRRNELMQWQRDTCRQLGEIERQYELQMQREQQSELQREIQYNQEIE